MSDLPADGTIDGDGVWRDGKWHPNLGDLVQRLRAQDQHSNTGPQLERDRLFYQAAAEIERLTRERDNARDDTLAEIASIGLSENLFPGYKAALPLIAERDRLTSALRETTSREATLRAALEKARSYVEDAAGMDCKVYTKHLSDGPCGTCWSCLAREALGGEK